MARIKGRNTGNTYTVAVFQHGIELDMGPWNSTLLVFLLLTPAADVGLLLFNWCMFQSPAFSFGLFLFISSIVSLCRQIHLRTEFIFLTASERKNLSLCLSNALFCSSFSTLDTIKKLVRVFCPRVH